MALAAKKFINEFTSAMEYGSFRQGIDRLYSAIPRSVPVEYDWEPVIKSDVSLPLLYKSNYADEMEVQR
jgi:hypothetical protein